MTANLLSTLQGLTGPSNEVDVQAEIAWPYVDRMAWCGEFRPAHRAALEAKDE